MKRQLYYLLPDVKHTKAVCNELQNINIPYSSIHAVMQEKSRIEGIGDVHSINEPDREAIIELQLWQLCLSMFALAFIAFLCMLILESTSYIFIPIIVMATTFLSGLYCAVHFPNVHWSEFSNGLHHGEVLLIVDVPKNSVHSVDHALHKHHPELISGGSCWKI